MDKPAKMRVVSSNICIPDQDYAASLGFTDTDMKISVLAPMVKRRTSLATRMAISAAERVCDMAGGDKDMPAIFVSSCGELQTTDKLCKAIAEQSYPLSPTQFHNSVHNTAAGYWSMSVKTHKPMQAMSGLDDGFALALLEAWCQLQTGEDSVLLVCYDEQAPEQLLPEYQWKPMALAMLLQADDKQGPYLSRPYQIGTESQKDTDAFSQQNPTFSGLDLMTALKSNHTKPQTIQLSSGDKKPWFIELENK